jgi:hypothetical protein
VECLPAKDPLGGMLYSEEHADDGPVHGPSVELLVAGGVACEGLEGGIAGEQKGEPGAGRRMSGVDEEAQGTYERRRERNDINMGAGKAGSNAVGKPSGN